MWARVVPNGKGVNRQGVSTDGEEIEPGAKPPRMVRLLVQGTAAQRSNQVPLSFAQPLHLTVEFGVAWSSGT